MTCHVNMGGQKVCLMLENKPECCFFDHTEGLRGTFRRFSHKTVVVYFLNSTILTSEITKNGLNHFYLLGTRLNYRLEILILILWAQDLSVMLGIKFNIKQTGRQLLYPTDLHLSKPLIACATLGKGPLKLPSFSFTF